MNRSYGILLIVGMSMLLASASWAVPAPASVRASDGTFSNYTLVQWTPVPGATAYIIEKAYTADAINWFFAGNTDGVHTQQYDITNNISGTPFFYKVRALVNGMWSSDSMVDRGYAYALPNNSSTVTASIFNGQLGIEWQPPIGGIESYAIGRALVGNGDPCDRNHYLKTVFGNGPTGQTWTFDSTAVHGNTYRYCVRTINPNGVSSGTISNSISFP